LKPFNKIYHPWNWRGWWTYGTGALGDMACHIMHTAFKALKLGYPTSVEASSTLLLRDCAPNAQHVKFIFPARENMPKLAMPEVEVQWYDGGMMPNRPEGFPEGKELMGPGGGLTIFHGTKDTLVCGCYGQQPFLLSGRVPNAPKVCRRVKNHEMDWVRACKESASNRVQTKSNFLEAGPFNEMIVMGVLAVRLQGLHRTLKWDGNNMQFTNIGDNEMIKTCIKDGFTIKDGHPSFAKDWTDPVNAKQYAAEMIKHALISSMDIYASVLLFDLDAKIDYAFLNRMVAQSVAVKERIVEEDPKEHGIRKALNFGHTIGHAYESLSFKKDRPLLHGHAVAAGIVSELYLSHKVCGFPMEKLSQVVYYLKEYYPAFVFDCKDYDTLYELMTHDKKNEAGIINFTLLSQVGDVQINQQVSKEKILESLDFYRESFGV